jgi:hypothetical protein
MAWVEVTEPVFRLGKRVGNELTIWTMSHSLDALLTACGLGDPEHPEQWARRCLWRRAAPQRVATWAAWTTSQPMSNAVLPPQNVTLGIPSSHKHGSSAWTMCGCWRYSWFSFWFCFVIGLASDFWFCSMIWGNIALGSTCAACVLSAGRTLDLNRRSDCWIFNVT